MLSTIKNMLFTAAVLVPAAFTAHTAVAQSNELFRISNESRYRINNVYMSPTGDPHWYGDRLYGYLQPAYHLDLQVNPGTYDIKVVDEDGDSCVITGVDVYEDEVWHLTNAKLLHCEGFRN